MILTIYRICTLLLGGFALGLTLSVLMLYVIARNKLRTSQIIPVYHVPLIGLSHALFIIACMGAIASKVTHDADFEYWLTPLASVGFAITTFALVGLLRSPKLRKMRSEFTDASRMM